MVKNGKVERVKKGLYRYINAKRYLKQRINNPQQIKLF
jgi:hypothetical protein